MTLASRDLDFSRKLAILKAKRNILDDSIGLEDLIETSNSVEDLDDLSVLFSLSLSNDFADRVFEKLDNLLDNLPNSSLAIVKMTTKALQEKINARIFLTQNFMETNHSTFSESEVDLKDVKIALTKIPSDDFIIPNILVKTSNNKSLSDNGKFASDLACFRKSLKKWHFDRRIDLKELDSFSQIFYSWKIIFCKYKVNSPYFLVLFQQIEDLLDLLKPESNYFKHDSQLLEARLIENLEILECFPKNLEELILTYPEYHSLLLLSSNEYLRNLASSLAASRFEDSLQEEKTPNKIQQKFQKLDRDLKNNLIDLDKYKEQVKAALEELKGIERKDLQTYLKYLKLSLEMINLPMDRFASKDLIILIDKLEEAQNTIEHKTQQQLRTPSILYYFKQIRQKATNIPDVLLVNSVLLFSKSPDLHQKIFIKIVKDLNIEYLSKIIQNQSFKKVR